ncbi:MAG TPA: RepB family plasmid replication initiator protein [Campylobacterales bacterium]|nr:RepB family plasmid replication initiator protein [Campylobacterales bacterium]
MTPAVPYPPDGASPPVLWRAGQKRYLQQLLGAGLFLPDLRYNPRKFEENGATGERFNMSMIELRQLLGLKHGKDDERIYEAIELLQTPMQIRDFTFKGREVSWMSASFLGGVRRWKDNEKYLSLQVDEMTVEALKQKAGYTPIELNICNQFKTKYGLKIYEMYLRYYSLPNNEGKGTGKISKKIDYLNKMFGTAYKTPSEIKRGIDRGIKEIEKITGELISCFYHKGEKKFIFGWHQKEKYPKLRIPLKHIDTLIDWYIHHNEDKLKIKSLTKYKKGLKQKIINDEFEKLDSFYRGLLKWHFNVDWVKYYDTQTGVYRDFEEDRGKI